jgi:hypothetical protein
MTMGSPTSRRAAALLIVLATLILTTTAATIVVRAAVTHQIDKRIDQCSQLADDLLAAAETPIQDWLTSKSSKIVLPPDSFSPEVAVLHDLWTSGGRERIELVITGWDQCGMVPFEAVENGSPLRMALAEEVLKQVPLHSLESPRTTTQTPAGLDQFIDNSETAGLRAGPFPVPTPSRPLHFGEAHNRGDNLHSPLVISSNMPRLGPFIATHNPLPGGAVPGAINVNTAPIRLVEAALRLAGRGGLEQVIAARQARKTATIGGQINPSTQVDHFAPQLVTTSNCWSFRIDINVGPRKRSWWAIYARGSGDREWECIQRLVITR